jgi:hypothetical protein
VTGVAHGCAEHLRTGGGRETGVVASGDVARLRYGCRFSVVGRCPNRHGETAQTVGDPPRPGLADHRWGTFRGTTSTPGYCLIYVISDRPLVCVERDRIRRLVRTGDERNRWEWRLFASTGGSESRVDERNDLLLQVCRLRCGGDRVEAIDRVDSGQWIVGDNRLAVDERRWTVGDHRRLVLTATTPI